MENKGRSGGLIVSLFLLGVVGVPEAWAQSRESVERKSSESMILTPPSEVCRRLVEAAQTDNLEEVKNLSIGMRSKAGLKPPVGMKNKREFAKNGSSVASSRTSSVALDPKVKERFDRMHRKYFERIKNMSCGAEQIAGHHAIVTAISGPDQRFIPFVEEDGAWKFDMKTYRAFYSEHERPKSDKSLEQNGNSSGALRQ